MRSGPLGPEDVVKYAYLIARRFVRREQARDIAQDTWIKYQRQLLKEGPEWETRRAQAWLRCVASNASRNLLRNAKPRGHEPSLLAGPDDPAERIAHAEEVGLQSQRVWALLAELPRKKRELFLLREMEGLSWAEISRLRGEKAHTLRARHSRCKSELKQRLLSRASPHPLKES